MLNVVRNPEAPKTLVMTGGTNGFGRRVVERFIEEMTDWRVLLLARPSPRTDGYPAGANGGRLDVVSADLTSLQSVDRACDAVLARIGEGYIDALALNAGIQEFDNGQVSADGLERTFAVNFLSHFAITERLVHRIRPGGRVVITGSEVHDPEAFCLLGIARATWQDPLELADVRLSQRHVEAGVERGEARYSASKLLNVMHARLLARQEPRLRVVSFNPSVVPGTGIARDRNVVQQIFWKHIIPPIAWALPGARSIERSAGDLFQLLTSAAIRLADEAPGDGRASPVPVSGDYVNGLTPEPGSSESRDEAKIARMHEVALQLIADARVRRAENSTAPESPNGYLNGAGSQNSSDYSSRHKIL